MNTQSSSRGPYCMAEMKGYNKYFRFKTAECNLRWDIDTGKRWAVDEDLHETYQHEERYKAYQEALLALLSFDEIYDNTNPLDLLEKARILKHRYFPDWWEKALQIFPDMPEKDSFPVDWQERLKHNVLFPQKTGNVSIYGMEHWQSLLETASQIIFLPDSREEFFHDIMTWIEPFYNTHQILIYVNVQESPFTVSEAFARHCLKQAQVPLSAVNFVRDTDSLVGLHRPDILEQVHTPQQSLIVAKGIWNYFSLFRHSIPFLFSFNNREDLAQGILQKAYSPAQPESLHAVIGYQTRPFPQHVSITGQDFTELSLEEFLHGQEPKTISEFLMQKEQKGKTLDLLSHDVHHDSGFFTIQNTGHGTKKVVRVSGPGENRVHLQGIRFDPADFTMTPLRFDMLKVADTIRIEEPGFLSNFSYFFTGNLQQMYNRLAPENEQLPLVDFPFDYMYEQRDGRWVETVPLYRKGCFGVRDDGSLFIGYLTMQKAEFELQGKRFTVPQQAINPGLREDFTLDDAVTVPSDEPVLLFTPSYPQERVGQERVNLVVVNEQILHCINGHDAMIPPVGVVLSLTPAFFEQHFDAITEEHRIHWNITFQEESALKKSALRWLYSGYNILVLNGENLVETQERLERNLQKEGWFVPQSARTQETQIHELTRQPRIVLGTTEQKKVVFLTIDGRTRFSCGATHIESVVYCQHLLQEDGDRLVNLVNLDGGASVLLEAREAGTHMALNFTAPSDLNPAGVIRPNSAFLKIVRTGCHIS